MMDMPTEVLEDLKCSSCELYLSRGPVYLQHDGAAACGQCYSPKRPAVRNKQYEAAVKRLKLKFPCKYLKLGCQIKVQYTEEAEVINHEEVCEHRGYVCPVRGSGHCDWLGPRAAIMTHCRDQHPNNLLEKCSQCSTEVMVFQYRNLRGWQCERCAPAKRACENQPQGCTHTDIDEKCKKHEWFFCQQITECEICDVSVSRGSLSAHYSSVHHEITHRTGSTWLATQTDGLSRDCFVTSVVGTAICSYWLSDSKFILHVHVPVSGERLSEFDCEVRVIDPVTAHAITRLAYIQYDEVYDWSLVVYTEKFESWTTGLDVCVDIRKVEL